MSLPGRRTIPAAVPVPRSSQPQQRESRRSKVLQSSLDLVFSYSRSQQLRYGPGGTGSDSAPSFVDGYPSSRSHSHSHSPPGVEVEAGIDEYEQQYKYPRRRDVRTSSDDLEAGISGTEPSPTEQIQHGHAPRHWSAGEEATFFPSDPEPILPSPSPDAYLEAAGPATHVRAAGADPPGSLPSKIPSSIVNDYFTPLSSPRSSALNSSGASKVSSGRIRRNELGGWKAEGKGVKKDGEMREATPLLGPPDRRYHATEEQGEMLDVPRGRRMSTVSRRRSIALEMGQSTDGQTLFNATAVLVGIGLLSLPLAFAYAGWIGGTAMLLFFGWLTCHTAKLLARIIRADQNLLGYTDIGQRAFGSHAGGLINVLFCLELFALGVALIVLFGDSLNVIYPAVSSNTWKMIGFVIILPTALLPLRLLSLPSLLSSLSSLLLVLVLLIDGLAKPSSPGSLRDPMPTSWTPEWESYNWLGGVGLVLAGFGGHAVMPSLARDMNRPENFDRVVNKAFAIATLISFVAGAAGYLMIGQTVSDEITRDVMLEKYHYPRALNLVALWMIVINPLTKFGLSSRPLNVTIESLLGISPAPSPTPTRTSNNSPNINSNIDQETHLAPPESQSHDIENGNEFAASNSNSIPGQLRHRKSSSSFSVSFSSPPGEAVDVDETSPSPARSEERRKAGLRVVSRTIVTALCTLTAVLLPAFGRVMAFLGSFSAFLICIILPLLFYLRLEPLLLAEEETDTEKTDMRSTLRRLGHWTLVGACTLLMLAGTAWAFVPGSGHGELDE